MPFYPESRAVPPPTRVASSAGFERHNSSHGSLPARNYGPSAERSSFSSSRKSEVQPSCARKKARGELPAYNKAETGTRPRRTRQDAILKVAVRGNQGHDKKSSTPD